MHWNILNNVLIYGKVNYHVFCNFINDFKITMYMKGEWLPHVGQATNYGNLQTQRGMFSVWRPG